MMQKTPDESIEVKVDDSITDTDFNFGADFSLQDEDSSAIKA
jgi:hypothetical protein